MAYVRLEHDRCEQGSVGSSEKNEHGTKYCYGRNNVSEVEKQEDCCDWRVHSSLKLKFYVEMQLVLSQKDIFELNNLRT